MGRVWRRRSVGRWSWRDRVGDGEREIAGVVGDEGYAIPILGGIANGQGLEHRI